MARVSAKSDHDGRLELLGAAIREVRAPGGVVATSQEKLADQAGVERAHMSRIERGKSNVTLLNVLKIADALGLPASELLKRAGL